jgi:hypothetical protein
MLGEGEVSAKIECARPTSEVYSRASGVCELDAQGAMMRQVDRGRTMRSSSMSRAHSSDIPARMEFGDGAMNSPAVLAEIEIAFAPVGSQRTSSTSRFSR